MLYRIFKQKLCKQGLFKPKAVPVCFQGSTNTMNTFSIQNFWLIFEVKASNPQYLRLYQNISKFVKMNFFGFPARNFYSTAFLTDLNLQSLYLTHYNQPILFFPNVFQSNITQSQRIFEVEPSLDPNLNPQQEKQVKQQYLVPSRRQPEQFQEKQPKKQTKKKVKTVHQTQFRNVNSNILKYFLKYVSEHKFLAQFYLRNIQTICDLDYKTFIEALRRRIPKNKNYIKLGLIRQICFGIGVDKKVGKAFRILFRKFMTTQFAIMMQHLKRVDTQAKFRYVQARRSLMNQVLKTPESQWNT